VPYSHGCEHALCTKKQTLLRRGERYKNSEPVACCGKDYDPDAVHLIRVNRRAGRTRPASSGSGLFKTSQQLVGTHLGGLDAGGFDYYGRFDRPYQDRMGRWFGVGGSGECWCARNL
jgi:hypothetical protein